MIELDIAFVRDRHLDPPGRAFPKTLTTFSAELGACPVAEGVETGDELTALL